MLCSLEDRVKPFVSWFCRGKGFSCAKFDVWKFKSVTYVSIFSRLIFFDMVSNSFKSKLLSSAMLDCFFLNGDT